MFLLGESPAQVPSAESRPAAPGSAGVQVYLLLALLATSVVLFVPVAANLGGWIADPGDPPLNAAILAWDVRALTRAPAHLFDAPWFYPDRNTLACSEHLLGNVPLAAPALLATGNPLLASNLLLLLTPVLAGWGAFLLIRHWTGNTPAALLSAFLLAFSPYRCAHLSHLQLFTTQWLPFVLLFLDRWLRERRWRDWAGLLVFFNLQFLCSYYVGLFLALTLTLLVVGYVLVRLAPLDRRLLGQLALWLVVTGAINLPLALPYERLNQAQGLERSLGEGVRYAARPVSYLTALPSSLLYGQLTAPLRQRADFTIEHALFLGLVTWGLVAVAVVSAARRGGGRRRVAVLASALLVLLVLSLGPLWPQVVEGRHLSLPYRLLFEFVPGFSGLRVPARLVTMVSFLAAVLAGVGAARLLPAHRRLGMLGAVALIVLFLAEVGPQWHAGGLLPTRAELPAVYRWLCEQPPGQVVMEFPVSEDCMLWPYLDAPRMYFGAYHHQRLVNGYSGFLPRRYRATLRACQGFPDLASRNHLGRLGVRYVVVRAASYEAGEWEALRGRLLAAPAVWPVAREFDDALVLELR